MALQIPAQSRISTSRFASRLQISHPSGSQIKSIRGNCDKRHSSSNPSFAWEKLLKNNYLSNGGGLPAAMTVGATRFRPPSLSVSGCGCFGVISFLEVATIFNNNFVVNVFIWVTLYCSTIKIKITFKKIFKVPIYSLDFFGNFLDFNYCFSIPLTKWLNKNQ